MKDGKRRQRERGGVSNSFAPGRDLQHDDSVRRGREPEPVGIKRRLGPCQTIRELAGRHGWVWFGERERNRPAHRCVLHNTVHRINKQPLAQVCMAC